MLVECAARRVLYGMLDLHNSTTVQPESDGDCVADAQWPLRSDTPSDSLPQRLVLRGVWQFIKIICWRFES